MSTCFNYGLQCNDQLGDTTQYCVPIRKSDKHNISMQPADLGRIRVHFRNFFRKLKDFRGPDKKVLRAVVCRPLTKQFTN